MSIQQRTCEYLSRKRIPFTIEHSEDESFVHGRPLEAAWRDSSLARVVPLFVNRQLAMLVIRDGAQVDPKLLARAVPGRQVELVEPGMLNAAFPDTDVTCLPPFEAFWQMPVYVDVDLDHEPLIRFRIGSPNDVVTLRHADFERLNQPITVRVTGQPVALPAEATREYAYSGARETQAVR